MFQKRNNLEEIFSLLAQAQPYVSEGCFQDTSC